LAFTFEAPMKYLFLCLHLCLATFVLAQSGQTAFTFTNIPVSGISAGLGGSQIAYFAGDVAQVIDNPAFVDSTLNGAVSLSYLHYLSSRLLSARGIGLIASVLGQRTCVILIMARLKKSTKME
jgi:hypothetical protein